MSTEAQRELQDEISDQANKQLRREELLMKRIQNLEAKIEATELKARIKSLEYFKDFVLIVAVGVSIYRMFV